MFGGTPSTPSNNFSFGGGSTTPSQPPPNNTSTFGANTNPSGGFSFGGGAGAFGKSSTPSNDQNKTPSFGGFGNTNNNTSTTP